MVKHETCHIINNMDLVLLTQLLRQTAKIWKKHQWKHGWKQTHSMSVKKNKKQNIISNDWLWNSDQLTDGMQFKLTRSINHVTDCYEMPFRLELKDLWCGCQIKLKSNLNSEQVLFIKNHNCVLMDPPQTLQWTTGRAVFGLMVSAQLIAGRELAFS